MLNKTEYSQRPEKVYVEEHEKGNDAWLRQNITEIPDVEGDGTHWEADEAYFKTFATEEEIEEDFDGYFDEASGWEPEKDSPVDLKQLRADVDYLLMMRGE